MSCRRMSGNVLRHRADFSREPWEGYNPACQLKQKTNRVGSIPRSNGGMSVKSVITLKLTATIIAALLLAGIAHGGGSWDRSASQGTRVYRNLHYDSPHTVSRVNHPTVASTWR